MVTKQNLKTGERNETILKSNRVMETNDRITMILACLRRDIVGIYAQKKLDELDEELGTQD